jgi:hypothetical protein
MSTHAINNPCILFSKEDADLAALRWGPNNRGYARKSINNKIMYAHRLVAARIHGKPLGPKNIVDHVSHDKLDNRRENLRVTTKVGNAQNRKPNPFRGTTWNKDRRKWQAQVMYQWKHYHCGLFACRKKAAAAARRKRDELGFLTDKKTTKKL